MSAEEEQIRARLMADIQAKATAMGVSLPAEILELSAPAPAGDGTESVSRTEGHDPNDGDPFSSLLGAVGDTRRREPYERVPGDIPIEKFNYGSDEEDWPGWVSRYEEAVAATTNAQGEDRLEQLYLKWISIKIGKKGQPMYDRCKHKRKDWKGLKAELAIAFEDPRIKRRWARYPDAYRRPSGTSLEAYKATVIGYVNRFSPAIAADPDAYKVELFNRFVRGLDRGYQEFIEDTIPYGKETIDNAYNQALKYEAKQAKVKEVSFADSFTGAAMTHAETDKVEKIRLDVEKLKVALDKNRAKEGSSGSYVNKSQRRDKSPREFHSPRPGGREKGYRSGSSSGKSRDSSNGSHGSYRAIETEDETSGEDTSSILVGTAQSLMALSDKLQKRKKGAKRMSRMKKD